MGIRAALNLRPVTALALLGLVLTCASLPARAQQWTPQQRAACEPDAMRLCNQYVATLAPPAAQYSRGEEEGEALPRMNDGQSTTHPEPDPAPFKVHLLTRAGRVMRARSEPVRAFSNKDEAVRFAGRQLGGHYAVYHKHKKVWPAP